MADDYFAEPEPRFKMPACTDTAGEHINRVGVISLRRVLAVPVNILGEGPHDYAMVFCEKLGLSLSRRGTTDKNAEWILGACHPAKVRSWNGVSGREAAIARFLKLLRIGKSYAFPHQPRFRGAVDKAGSGIKPWVASGRH